MSSPTPSSRALRMLSRMGAALLLGCGAGPQSEGSLVEAPTHSTSVEVYDPTEADEAAASTPAEESSVSIEETASSAPPAQCVGFEDVDGADRQLGAFSRWLRDQTVGRHLTIEGIAPQCASRGGFMVVRTTLSGTGHELQSLARAFSAYYPGARYHALGHEELEGEVLRLRAHVEIEIPEGDSPRPRCTWDPAVECR